MLTVGFADAVEHFDRGGMHKREHLADQLTRLICDVDEQLSSVVRVRFAAHQSAALEGIE
jgi:hypothetical protein